MGLGFDDILVAVNIIEKINGYLKTVESRDDLLLDNLIKMPLKAGDDSLLSICRGQGRLNFDIHIRDAIHFYKEASHLEDRFGKFYAYYGLAICHHLIYEENNMMANLQNAIKAYRSLESDERVYYEIAYPPEEEPSLSKMKDYAVMTIFTLGMGPIFDRREKKRYIKRYEEAFKKRTKAAEVAYGIMRKYPNLDDEDDDDY